jgi:hypothetical protein
MQTINDQLTVAQTGNWNSPNPSIGGESLIVIHSENGTSPGVTFANVGGEHFVHQFTFGTDANLPGGVAGNVSADWHGLTLTGHQGMVFSVGELGAAPSVAPGDFVFANANVEVSKNLGVSGQATVSQDLTVNGKLTVAQIDSATIVNLQAAVQGLKSGDQNTQLAIAQLQADVQQLYGAVGLIQANGG